MCLVLFIYLNHAEITSYVKCRVIRNVVMKRCRAKEGKKIISIL